MRALRTAGLALAAAASASLASSPPGGELIPRMVEPGPESGLVATTVAAPVPWVYILDNIGTGVALLDYDLDGDLDIFQVQASALEGFPGQPPPTDHLYRNEGGGRFKEVTQEAHLGDSAWGQGAIAGDYDNDGDPDLFVTSIGPDRLYRNEGDGTFKEVGAQAGVDNERWGASAAFFDYDSDGLLDLYVTKYVDFDPTTPRRGDPDSPCKFRGVPVVCGPMALDQSLDILFHNNGDGTFSNANRETGMLVDEPRFGLGVVTGDVDNDGDQDFFVSNDSEPNFLYINDGRGRFSEEGLLQGVAYAGDGRGQASMGCAFGDPDADGDLDLFVSHFASDYSTFYSNDGAGLFEDQTLRTGLMEPMLTSLCWGTAFLDFDNDGDEDLFSSNGHVYPEATEPTMSSTFLQRCQLFLNDGTGKFIELAGEAAGPALNLEAAHRGAAFGDIDEDGDVDVIVTRMFDRLGFYRNDLPPGNHWISIRLHGRRSNRDAIGARVVVHAGGRQWLKERHGGGSFESSNDPRLHVGLGPATRVDRVEIRWPSGLTETHGPIKADQTVTFVEPARPPDPVSGP